ncbi:hypothetical protein GQ53DRAFT_848361 [Thozetella sp. PMI_491]|nr:hypothetical protein GQ53DRAFT_848361 [Thozetella sp. PMI_491]
MVEIRRKGSDDSRQSRFLRTGSTSSARLSPSPSRTIDESSENIPEGLSRASTSVTLDGSRPGKGGEPDSGPLGLNVVYTPNNGHKADIVFVHGLGGTSRWTWSKNKNPELFWPLTFLALEADICLARTLTFGYNAAFHKSGDGKTSVLDFAENLLHDLKYSEDANGKSLNIGAVPLIFVCHSMGGLVVKEACIKGSGRPQFKPIIDAVEAIVFLATPHRGAQVAQLLNKILQSVIITNTKQYVSDLLPTSSVLENQAESFRHIAHKFKIMSFYETQPTAIGFKNTKIMLLGKETSVLGYPDEISRGLDADHHNVCKYNSPKDPNYIIVRGALRILMKNIVKRPDEKPATDRRSSESLQALLALGEIPTNDLLFYRGQWKAGTCTWILDDEDYLDWSQSEEPASRLLWLNGGAATGKSVISSFVVKTLEEGGANCQYFYIRHGQPMKRTLSMILRSIAFQIALSSPDYQRQVFALEDEQLDFETMDAKSIWERLFRSILFRIQLEQRSYWVIDALDEADNPRALIELLSELVGACPSIRVLVTSRNTPELVAAFEPLSPTSIGIDGRLDDIRYYIRREVLFTGSPELKEKIIKQLQKRAQNNFLFVSLAVAELNSLQNRSYEEVKAAISRFPKGMEAFYDRMARSIAMSSQSDKAMATKVLQCVNCSNRALTVPELAQILGEDRSNSDHFKASMLGACYGFIIVDEGSKDERGNVAPRVTMIHQTSREYLLSGEERPFRLNLHTAHAQMFQSCMDRLMSTDLKTKVKQYQDVEFLDYAANFWSSHLISTPSHDTHSQETLQKFLTEQRSGKEWILIWIHYLAASRQLRVLTQVSRHLSKQASRLSHFEAGQNETGRQTLELKELLESWAIDLIKIAGKYSSVLLRSPRAIYKSIPPFCPRSSPIYQQFGQKEAKNLAVSGPSAMMEKWDDSLARMTFGTRAYSTSVSAAGHHIAVLAPIGKVFTYDSSTFEQPSYGAIDHNERVTKMELSSNGTLVATYGYDTTKIWEITTGHCLHSTPNLESRPRPHTMIFTNNDNTLLVGFEDSKIMSLDLRQTFPTWEEFATIEEKEIKGHILNVPSNMALNRDGTRLAIAYRGHPLSAWKLREGKRPKHSGYLWRRGLSGKKRGEVEDVVWHPNYKLVLGVYIDGTVFKWRPGFKDSSSKRPRWEPKEIATGASKISMSKDGHLFVTGDPRGAVKIYTTVGFHLLYHLASEDMVGGITFNPDMTRLYDTRGYYASAWEPTALVRWAEQMHSNSDSFDSKSEMSFAQNSAISVNWTQTVDSITVIATPASRHYLFCVGTAAGGVTLHHTNQGKLAEIRKAEGLFGIDKMALSRDGKYVCFIDSVKTLVIVSINHDDKTTETTVKEEVEISLSQVATGSILDVLFHQDTTHILVQCSSSIHSISLASLSIEKSAELEAEDARWIPHPGDKTRLVGLSATTVQVFDWNLSSCHSYSLIPPSTLVNDFESPVIQGKVDRVLASLNGKYIVAQVTPPADQGSQEKQLFCIEVSLLPSSKTDASKINQSPTIDPLIVPQDMSSQVALALGFVKGNRLIFLSKASSVSYWEIDFNQLGRQQAAVPITVDESIADVAESIDPLQTEPQVDRRRSTASTLVPSNYNLKEIFPLPGDWVSQDSLMVSTLWTKERSFLCPRNGEVAVVRTPDLRVSKD